MNIYKCLNELTKFIDDNLEEEIDYEKLSRFLGVNVYTMKRIFAFIAGISLPEYIRKRRLSSAGYDLYNDNAKVIDIAVKYQYDNATSFSRAFEKFHGIKPSEVEKTTKLKNYPRIIFNEEIVPTSELEYEIVELESITLYGKGIETSNETIANDAPKFFMEMENKYKEKYGEIDYGVVTYDDEHETSRMYYCMYKKEIKEFDVITLPKSKWLKFRINNQVAKDIQDISQRFYNEFLPSCKYNLKEIPELEYYHDNITDFLVAIY